MVELRLGLVGGLRIWQKNLNDYTSPLVCAVILTMGALAWSLSHAGASLNVDVEVLQIEYQLLLQTVGKDLLTSLRFRHLIP
ncbi:hypothetical protein PS900_03023 [Pseudomonas fluorescens]|uniref:Uncharacterized protein n=1 Tax=Pseudomonas fluorescens TaxID=294 RepID=A0A8H2NSD7_PSEFL|nr:hypothetical protein PS900_03023 [Pseudomonas fluorescens]